MKKPIKSGDRLYHILYGWGEVEKISSENFGTTVFQDHKYSCFLDDKHKYENLLSFKEYTIVGLTLDRDQELPNVGEIVWVRNHELEDWVIAHFVTKVGEYYAVSNTIPISNNFLECNCTYYNELTTTNPYEDFHIRCRSDLYSLRSTRIAKTNKC